MLRDALLDLAFLAITFFQRLAASPRSVSTNILFPFTSQLIGNILTTVVASQPLMGSLHHQLKPSEGAAETKTRKLGHKSRYQRPPSSSAPPLPSQGFQNLKNHTINVWPWNVRGLLVHKQYRKYVRGTLGAYQNRPKKASVQVRKTPRALSVSDSPQMNALERPTQSLIQSCGVNDGAGGHLQPSSKFPHYRVPVQARPCHTACAFDFPSGSSGSCTYFKV